MSKHIENGRYWAEQFRARDAAGDITGAQVCIANAAHCAAQDIVARLARDPNINRAYAEALRANAAYASASARRQRAWNGGGRGR